MARAAIANIRESRIIDALSGAPLIETGQASILSSAFKHANRQRLLNISRFTGSLNHARNEPIFFENQQNHLSIQHACIQRYYR